MIRVSLKPTIVEHHRELLGTEIEQGRRVPWDTFLRHIVGINATLRPKADAAVTKRQRHSVARGELRVVTGGAGNRAVAGQDRIEKEAAAQKRFLIAHGQVVRIGDGVRQTVCKRNMRGGGEDQSGGCDAHAVSFAVLS